MAFGLKGSTEKRRLIILCIDRCVGKVSLPFDAFFIWKKKNNYHFCTVIMAVSYVCLSSVNGFSVVRTLLFWTRHMNAINQDLNDSELQRSVLCDCMSSDIKITISCLLTAACHYYHGVATLQSCCAVIQKSKGTLELLHYVWMLLSNVKHETTVDWHTPSHWPEDIALFPSIKNWG